MYMIPCIHETCTHTHTYTHTHLHQADGYVVEDVIESCAIEDSVVAKVVLEPAGLSLTGGHQASRHQPCPPAVAIVPQQPPSQKVDQEDVSKQSHKEPRVHFEHALWKKKIQLWISKSEHHSIMWLSPLHHWRRKERVDREAKFLQKKNPTK